MKRDKEERMDVTYADKQENAQTDRQTDGQKGDTEAAPTPPTLMSAHL